MLSQKCPTCQDSPLVEAKGVKPKVEIPGAIILQCEKCGRFWRRYCGQNYAVLESIRPDEIIVPNPQENSELDLEKYLVENGWHRAYIDNREFVGWWHPEISPQRGKVYPPGAAQIIQNGIDDFIYSHLKRP